MALFCLYYSGLEWLLARLIPVDAAAVLMYHGVCDNAPIPEQINFHVEGALFDLQMRLLKRRYRIVPLAEVVAALAHKERLRKCVALTFDDGYKNNALRAAPILRKYALPSTIFVATAYVSTDNWIPLNEVYWRWVQGELTSDDMARLRKKLRGLARSKNKELIEGLSSRRIPDTEAARSSFAMLDWSDIKEMAQAGVEFGSHTHTHCNMAVEDTDDQLNELRTSKRLLEDHLGVSIQAFAYPYGHAEHMSETSRHNIIHAGYDCAISGEYGLVTSEADPFRLPRLGYDRRPWMFTGEICYQFTRQAVKDAWSRMWRRHSKIS